MVLVFISILVVVSVLPFIIKRIVETNNVRNSIVRIVINILTILGSLLLLSSLFMSNFNTYLVGYKTTTFILIATALLFAFNYILTEYKNKIVQRIIEFLLFIFIFVSSSIVIISLAGYSSNNFYSTSKYRLEAFHFIKGSRFNLPDLYVKDGILEKRYSLNFKDENQDFGNYYFNKESITNYKITQMDSQITVVFQFDDGYEVVTETFLDGSCD